MEKMSAGNDLVTKSSLKRALEPLATKKDFFRLENRIDDLEEKFTHKLIEFKDKIVTAMDAVMEELKAMREEITASGSPAKGSIK